MSLLSTDLHVLACLALQQERWQVLCRYREARMRWAAQSDKAIMSGTGAPALSGMTL